MVAAYVNKREDGAISQDNLGYSSYWKKIFCWFAVREAFLPESLTLLRLYSLFTWHLIPVYVLEAKLCNTIQWWDNDCFRAPTCLPAFSFVSSIAKTKINMLFGFPKYEMISEYEYVHNIATHLSLQHLCPWCLELYFHEQTCNGEALNS